MMRSAPSTFFATALSLFLGLGCGSDQADPSITDVYQEPESGMYIVDGDIPLRNLDEVKAFYAQYAQPHKEVGQQSSPLIVNREGSADDVWGISQRQNLTYCISTGFGTRYETVRQAMTAAASAWETAANVHFVYRPNQDSNCTAANRNVVFDVRPVSGAPYFARAFFPHNDRTERSVLIDATAFSPPAPRTLTGILRHELGHSLGFRHEHIRPEAGPCDDSENTNWRVLTPYDAASVMHYPQCPGSTSNYTLTQRDRDGAAALYGPPSMQLPGAAYDIGVGANGTAWVIGTNNVGVGDHGVLRWTGSDWETVGGGGVRIAVDPSGSPWIVNAVHQIFHFVGGTWVQLPGAANDIGVGADGTVWVIGTNDVGVGDHGVLRWTGSGWEAVGGGGVRIAVDPSGAPWIVNAAHQIFRRSGDTWVQLPGAANDIAVGPNGTAWVVGTNNVGSGNYGVYRWTGSTWQSLGRGGVAISVGAYDLPWIVNAQNAIWRQ